MATSKRSELVVGERTLSLSNLEKVLFPADGFTKGDLIAYYRSVASAIVPHLAGRPLTMERYPDGLGHESWWEKHAPRGLPAWVPTTTVPSEHGKRTEIAFVVCDDEATLAYVANLGSITLHVWTSRLPDLDEPDLMLFDLDPFDGCTLATLAKTALLFHETCKEIGLEPLVKTTGGSGLHVVLPLAAGYSYDTVKVFAEIVARRVHALAPETTTLERTIAKRPKGTVYLDFVQVGRGKTLTAPFTVRARDGAPVSMPLAWDDVAGMARKRAKTTEPEMARWTIRNVPELVAKHGDPWAGAAWKPQHLEAASAAIRDAWPET
jgi:bifunctional non-homologous end joining protein LigD